MRLSFVRGPGRPDGNELVIPVVAATGEHIDRVRFCEVRSTVDHLTEMTLTVLLYDPPPERGETPIGRTARDAWRQMADDARAAGDALDRREDEQP